MPVREGQGKETSWLAASVSVGKGDHTRLLFKLSWTGLDLGFGNKLINFFFPTETVRPFKEEIQESSSKIQELQESNQL